MVFVFSVYSLFVTLSVVIVYKHFPVSWNSSSTLPNWLLIDYPYYNTFVEEGLCIWSFDLFVLVVLATFFFFPLKTHTLADNSCCCKFLEDMVNILHVPILITDRRFGCSFSFCLSGSCSYPVFDFAKALEGKATF